MAALTGDSGRPSPPRGLRIAEGEVRRGRGEALAIITLAANRSARERKGRGARCRRVFSQAAPVGGEGGAGESSPWERTERRRGREAPSWEAK